MSHRDPVGADEGEPLLGLEAYRFEASRLQGRGAWHSLSFVVRFAPAYEDLPDLRHLRQVALPHRASRAHDGVDARVQGVEKGLYQLGTHADAALGHTVRPRGHHSAHYLGADLRALVSSVAGNQAHGELLQVLEGDAIAGERAHPRVHAVDEVAALQNPVYHVPGAFHAVQGLDRNLDACAAAGDADDLLDGEIVAGQNHGSCCWGERQGDLRVPATILLPPAGLSKGPVPDWVRIRREEI